MIRCGFFNSVNNDKTYDAEDMGKIFEGIISDGVFNNINKGNSFKVTKNNNTMTVNIAAGKAWFYNRYFEIVGNETITLRNGDVNPRIDTICIKLDNSSSVRDGSLYVQEGTPDTTPHRPSIANTDTIKYLPIADILIPANAVNVNSAVIANLVGTIRCPYSETTLDPRRAMYAFEGETAEASIPLFSVKTYEFEFDLDQNIFAPGGVDVAAKHKTVSISKETLGLDSLTNVEIFGQILYARIYSSDVAYVDADASKYQMIFPLVINKNSNNVSVSSKCMSGYNSHIAGGPEVVRIKCRLIMIIKEEI